ncbi:MAG: HPr kinase/phosphatase C-terminal domain-containing protein [Desulfomonile tiedjei]|uniref:HPr kinase/phosphatase C-terminal domain-containing protein n=1 Tax=Desulfomonile tiedjei TaxID=2358 RepID=A0A9D6Z8H6_9BACT|nr:HPr kinase/phosphatase C-terminal domain-containing protein [Desulfomonile tiedjei]
MGSKKIRGCLVQIHGVGVIIRGRSGSGKSLAALSLMRQGHRLVADDLVEVISDPGAPLIGKPLEQDVRIEVRGLGVFRAATLFPQCLIQSSSIDFIADLDVYDPIRDSGRIEPETRDVQLLDRNILAVRVPLASGMDPALLIEILAMRLSETGTVKP